jgi:hypothetical protein
MLALRLDRRAGLGVLIMILASARIAAGGDVGACCLPDGSCDELTPEQCEAENGIFQGFDVPCEDVDCDLLGACCFFDGTCAVRSEDDCTLLGGVSWHPGETCESIVCDLLGACCFSDCEPCEELTREACEERDGVYQGDGTPCDAVVCPVLGACCFTDLPCVQSTETQCDVLGGVSWHACIDCAEAPCLERGACCFFDGTCVDGVTEDECFEMPDAVGWHSGESCGDAACEPLGACCFFDGQCAELTRVDCTADGGAYQGDGVRCLDLLCPFVQEASFDFPLSPGEAFFDIELFDDLNGTRQLDEVHVRLLATVGANVTVTNLSETLPAIDLIVFLTGLITTDLCDLHLGEPVNGDWDVDIIPPGETFDFGRVNVDIDAETGTSDPLRLAEFIGDGTLPLHVYAEGTLSVQANVPVLLSFDDFRSTGVVTITYVYSFVEPCPSDINGDGVVDVSDLLAVLAAWGQPDEEADLNNDGNVNINDLLMVLGDWGDCP